MKPFTPIIARRPVGADTRLCVSTSPDQQILWLQSFTDTGTHYDSYAHALDRETAKWLRKQLKKALKQPKEDVV